MSHLSENEMNVEISRVTKTYGKREILKSISLSVKEGEWLSVVGPSGAGKSTILHIIAGLLRADSGQVNIGPIESELERRKIVGYLFQDFPLYPSLTVAQNLKAADSRRYNANGPSYEEMVSQLQIETLLAKLPVMLSGGERQRVALARTILLRRPVLLLDEPFSNTDQMLRKRLRRYCRQFQSKWCLTVILVTHDQEDAMTTSDKVAFLESGVLVQYGSPVELFSKPASKAVGNTFGDVGMVWLPENVFPERDSALLRKRPRDNGRVGIRETDFELAPSCTEESFKVEVIGSEYLGSRRRVFVRHDGEEFSIVTSDESIEGLSFIWLSVRATI